MATPVAYLDRGQTNSGDVRCPLPGACLSRLSLPELQPTHCGSSWTAERVEKLKSSTRCLSAHSGEVAPSAAQCNNYQPAHCQLSTILFPFKMESFPPVPKPTLRFQPALYFAPARYLFQTSLCAPSCCCSQAIPPASQNHPHDNNHLISGPPLSS